jgi:endonuclease/exonuclease/phosphatase (EEP) superfamily protein YafD
MLTMIGGTALNLFFSEHWFVRGWDFPRLQIVTLIVVPGVIYFSWLAAWNLADVTLLLAGLAAIGWQMTHILPYTPVWRKQVEQSEREAGPSTLRVVISNVEMENDAYDRWRKVVKAEDPDVIFVVEVDDGWCEKALDPLRDDYTYELSRPQDNWYGMAMLSKLEPVDPKWRYLVEDDVPSIHTGLRLRSGKVIRFVGVHPKPPEPIRDQDATQRDAELVVIGRELDDDPRPSIICGDLNDVAWSYTTRLFLRLSGMLDPRRGRGMFNSWNAKSYFFRFPLDHVFHTNDFRLRQLRKLGNVGSDHFPVLIELSYEPSAEDEQPEPDESEADEQTAQRLIDKEESESGERVASPEAHAR